MGTRYTLITGANGEIGHGLIAALSRRGESDAIIALDLVGLDDRLTGKCEKVITGDITDKTIIEKLESYPIREIFHLAALLSTSAERVPERAHAVNVNGTLGLLEMAHHIGKHDGVPVKFLFPSSIAAYGIPSLSQKEAAGKVPEREWNTPTTMYGLNKLYCEQLGVYYSEHYKSLSEAPEAGYVDFRALRFPGLISAFTIPSGGTSDYASEMLHNAAQNKPYACFVRADTRIPFMAMPDAVRALLELAAVPRERLTQRAYNIGAFAPTAAEILAVVEKSFPGAKITYRPNPQRQGIVDTWPADVDDSAARRDWDWRHEFDFEKAFFGYLVPKIHEFYRDRNQT